MYQYHIDPLVIGAHFNYQNIFQNYTGLCTRDLQRKLRYMQPKIKETPRT
jgi:hypothetical protein